MSDINKNDHINRGIDFLLNGGRKKKQPKTFQILVKKVASFLRMEVAIYFEFSLDIKKIDRK